MAGQHDFIANTSNYAVLFMHSALAHIFRDTALFLNSKSALGANNKYLLSVRYHWPHQLLLIVMEAVVLVDWKHELSLHVLIPLYLETTIKHNLPSLQKPAAAVRTSFTFNKNTSTKLCKNVSLLHLAALHGWMDIVANLASMSDCKIQCRDDKKQTPLHYAACGGSLPVVDYLISEQHCDPNSREEKGSTAFSYACEEGHMNIVQYLSGHGGDPALSNKKGDMPIHIACLAGHLSIVKYLINVLKCDPNSKGFQGCTPLHHVCGNDHMDIIKYLIIKQCCDPTFIDSNGMTPLHHASLSGHTAVVRWLLQDERVHVLNKDKFGRTPINCAELHRDRSIELLKLFRKILRSWENHPIHLLLKSVLTGNSGAGKSTLAHGIIEEGVSFLQCTMQMYSYSNWLKVSHSVKPLTAGIVSHTIHNKKVNNMILFDLAMTFID